MIDKTFLNERLVSPELREAWCLASPTRVGNASQHIVVDRVDECLALGMGMWVSLDVCISHACNKE